MIVAKLHLSVFLEIIEEKGCFVNTATVQLNVQPAATFREKNMVDLRVK